MLKFISKNLLTGLMTILPIIITLYFLYWLGVTAETVLGNMIRLFLPNHLYSPGMGLGVALVVLFMIGLLMQAYVVRRLFARGEQLLYRMPMVKWVYRSLRDFLDYFSPTKKREFEQVVSVSIGSCNADSAVRQSIESAVRKASPLPTPRDPSVFSRDIRLIFRPED